MKDARDSRNNLKHSILSKAKTKTQNFCSSNTTRIYFRGPKLFDFLTELFCAHIEYHVKTNIYILIKNHWLSTPIIELCVLKQLQM